MHVVQRVQVAILRMPWEGSHRQTNIQHGLAYAFDSFIVRVVTTDKWPEWHFFAKDGTQAVSSVAIRCATRHHIVPEFTKHKESNLFAKFLRNRSHSQISAAENSRSNTALFR